MSERRAAGVESQQARPVRRAGSDIGVNRHSTVTHYQRPTVTQLQEGGTGGEVSEILFFSAKSKRRPSLIYSMQIIPVCLSIVARRKGVSATRRGGSNWTPISLLVGHPCKLFNRLKTMAKFPQGIISHLATLDRDRAFFETFLRELGNSFCIHFFLCVFFFASASIGVVIFSYRPNRCSTRSLSDEKGLAR